MEGLTDEQRAFRIRKLKTRFSRLDNNGDGSVTVEDYDELIKKFIDYGDLSEEQVTRRGTGKKMAAAYALYKSICSELCSRYSHKPL